MDLWGTDLVVLAACKTGVGEIQIGEGAMGLRRAFQQAGARTVVTSLWSVDDGPTAALLPRFLGHYLAGMPKAEALRNSLAQTKITRNLSNEAVEKILQGLELKYSKTEPKDKDTATMYFDFLRGEQPCRLKNYGSDLWLECIVEKKMKVEDVNRWNADAKFSRLVLIEEKDKTILSLESQLDCLGGVTDAMIKQYLVRFDEEAKKFAKFVK